MANTARKRVRTIKTGSEDNAADVTGRQADIINKLKRKVKKHLELQNQIDLLQATQNDLDREIEQIMKENEIASIPVTDRDTNTVWVAEIVTPVGRASRQFDNQKVFDLLGEDRFLQVVKVMATKIKGFLSEKEIDRVSTMIPGETKPPVLTIKRSKGK